MRRWVKYLIAALLPMTVLISKPIEPLFITLFGEEVRLRVDALDPREVFRGDYVGLYFEALERPKEDELSRESIGDAAPLSPGGISHDYGRAVYLTLKSDSSGISQPGGIFAAPPKDSLYLKARVMRPWAPSVIRLDFGANLKRFYVRENTGEAIEDAVRKGRTVAVVKVWRGLPLLVSLDIKP